VWIRRPTSDSTSRIPTSSRSTQKPTRSSGPEGESQYRYCTAEREHREKGKNAKDNADGASGGRGIELLWQSSLFSKQLLRALLSSRQDGLRLRGNRLRDDGDGPRNDQSCALIAANDNTVACRDGPLHNNSLT
jgi:hypothetical protein